MYVHHRVPVGSGPDTVVHQHRADPDRERWLAVAGRVLLVDPVIHHHEDVQDARRKLSDPAVGHVRHPLGAGLRLDRVILAGDQQQEPRANPRRTHLQLIVVVRRHPIIIIIMRTDYNVSGSPTDRSIF